MGNIAIAFATSTITFSEFVEVKRQKKLESKRIRSLVPTYIARLNRSDATITAINLNRLGVDTNILRLLTAPINRGQTSALTELYLEHNWFGPEGAAVVARVLSHNTHLKIVSVSHNHIGSIGAMAIANALEHNNVLERLNLNYCEIDDDGVKKLATSLKKNHTLKYLNLEGNFLSSEGIRALLNCVYDTSGGIQSLFDSNHTLISYHNGQRTIYNPNFPETTVSNRLLVFQLASVLASCNLRYSQPTLTTTASNKRISRRRVAACKILQYCLKEQRNGYWKCMENLEEKIVPHIVGWLVRYGGVDVMFVVLRDMPWLLGKNQDHKGESSEDPVVENVLASCN
mmetsp:Transcript_20805/g.29799  ORF Transcript_20805/g.29799 Transcript_20805/m.29799 type:complete len:343 (-) Transcript_20805:81-1109(-)|eukprot:CAMPEP_0201689996 /NCGR_PEP_ID=MMETSP0578-20130828/3511_1 /ASSEMBLY_ACC=CAM_ASM_000663 /TAXON_ID=267565 /ORGANISM="Skeletonema grethea, Strain CCMP 1804" /LENGTH=342 /DNA_ID=CAMNT_0048174841 /DNA_START=18 /DNA_END=1046 /DNA_ORIENTATION=+